MKRRPRMLRQVFTGRQTGDTGVDALRWGSPGAKRKTRRAMPKPTPPPRHADPMDDLCRWLDVEDGEDGEK